MEVELKLPKKKLFIGSYIKVSVIIDPSSGRPIEDLDFVIPDGPQAGIISLSRDANFKPDKPDVMLCVGYQKGRHTLEAWSKQSNSVVAETQFRVTDIWEDDVEGPSAWFTGVSELYTAGSTWGGGPPGRPQNLNVRPALGVRRIAIILVDTASQRFTNVAATLQGIRDRWLDETTRGVSEGSVSVIRSVAHYYREVSYGKFEVTAQVFGPFSLSGNWDDYFNADRSPKGNFYTACITLGIGQIDYNTFDTVLCVSQSVNPTNPVTRKFAWPYATIGPSSYMIGYDELQPIFRSLGAISMPNEWPEIDGRQIHQTLSHELGHNLGLGDLYAPEVKMAGIKTRNLNS
jgi:hypothetical protein